jgi:4-methoxybenzoate monooxygenase (O-demethylating)
VAQSTSSSSDGHDRAASGVPTIEVDPYSTEVLSDPYPFHHELREAGPVVWLEPHGVWATGRYEQVRTVLTDWETFISGAGTGLVDVRVDHWREPSLLLESDPPEHTVVREIMERILLPPDAFENVRERFEAKAEALVDSLVSAGSFDAVTEFAEVFPVQAFGDEVGIPEEGRENLLAYADIVFNGQGPRNELFDAATENAEEIQEWIASSCERENLDPDGFGAQIYEAADEGEITEEQAGMLVRSLLSAGLDTTVSALSSAVHLLATNPDQWEQLRADPSLARPVFEETIRFESPVQQFFRTAAHDTELASVEIAQDDRVMIFFGSANRDPRQWEDPDRFDVTRKPSGHLAFGTGIHGCLGQLIARTEGEMLFAALARKVGRIELDGEPQRHLNNSVRRLARLPVNVHAL